jgi:hypothetical protein
MSVLWLNGHVPEIPEIDDETLTRLLGQIKPIFKTDDGYRFIEPVDPRKKAFTWDPQYADKVDFDLYELAKIETYHRCGYIAMFKPSLAEVIAQIPKHLLVHVDAFEMMKDADGDFIVGCFGQGDGHRAMVQLYSKHAPYSNEFVDREDAQR